jgi:hypothetical protein
LVFSRFVRRGFRTSWLIVAIDINLFLYSSFPEKKRAANWATRHLRKKDQADNSAGLSKAPEF